MSIRGIDNQIMVARTSDVARDSTAMQKKPEVTQDYQAIQTKMNVAHDQQRVAQTNESEMEHLRPDEDGGNSAGQGGGGGGSKSGEKEQEEDLGPGMFVPRSIHAIDITV